MNWQDAANPLNSLIIVQYDKVKGTHIPTCVGHLKYLLTQLQLLQADLIVHGDIRLSNVIFSTVTDSSDIIETTLIDFDFSGVHGEQTYPSRFNHDIGDDGSRHKDATSGRVVKCEHDVYSAFWIINKYQTIGGQQFDTTGKELEDVIRDLSHHDERDEVIELVVSTAT